MPASLTVSNLNDSGAGSLRQAILDANASQDTSSTITLNSSLSGTIWLESALDPLKKNITIVGTGQVSAARDQEADTAFGILAVNANTNCEVDYLGLVGGNSVGVRNAGTLYLDGCWVEYNSGSSGGGIFNGQPNGQPADLSLNNCLVEYNSSTIGGGGIYNNNGSVLCIATSIDYNTAQGDGGGIYNTGANGYMDLESCSVNGNTANGAAGGGIYSDAQTLIMNGGSLSSNSAIDEGGGVAIWGGTVTVSNVQIKWNQVPGSNNNPGPGGGFFAYSGTVTFNTCTFSGNTASSGKGGVFDIPATTCNINNCNGTDVNDIISVRN